MKNTIRISELAEMLNLQYVGIDVEIDGLGLANREADYSSILSYVTNKKYVDVIVNEELHSAYSAEALGRNIAYIITDKPEICFYTIHERLCSDGLLYEKYNFEPRIGRDCSIDKSAVIENGVVIGNHVTIGSNTVVRSGSIIDDDTTIGCNTTIGSEGFQLITDGDNPPLHITHVGRCHISKNVYIGDNTCICNSLFGGETYVGENVKIDNLVHVAHNLYIGKNAVVTAHVILCGSSRIEEGAWIAPNSSVLNRVVIGKGSKVGLGSVVTRDVAPYTVVYGSPAKVHEKH